MAKLSKHSFLFLICCLLGMGCQDTTGSANVPSSITGEIHLYDVDADSKLVDHSGVMVWLYGTSITTVTDVHGRYTLTDVPPGIYILMGAKSGFDTLSTDGIEYSGAGVEFLHDLRMYTLSEGDLTLEPVIRQYGRGFIDHPDFDSLSIREVETADGTHVFDTIVHFNGRAFFTNHEYYYLQGNAVGMANASISPFIKTQSGEIAQLHAIVTSNFGNTRYYLVLAELYISRGVNPGDWPLSIFMRGGKRGQVIESGPQLLP